MTTQPLPFPPLAQALGRLRARPAAPRAWPANPRPLPPAGESDAPGETPRPAPATAAPEPGHDFLRMIPEPAFHEPAPAPAAPPRERLTAAEAIALAPVNRTFWFDL